MKNFQQLISSVEPTHRHLQSRAVHAVNQILTICNWLIGYYIMEFEQNRADRAEYGEKLKPALAEQLCGIKRIDQRSLFRFRNFYFFYTYIVHYVVEATLVKSQKYNILKNMSTLSPQLSMAKVKTLSHIWAMSFQFLPKRLYQP